jgi:hypothetical protein
MRTLRHCAIAAVVGTACLVGSAAVAGAQQPVVQACIGSTFSQGAHNLHAEGLPFGRTIIVPFAQAEEGNLGGGIQNLQAGLVPDEVALNTCNDG